MTKGKLTLRSVYVSMAKETMETLIFLVKYLFYSIDSFSFLFKSNQISQKKKRKSDSRRGK